MVKRRCSLPVDTRAYVLAEGRDTLVTLASGLMLSSSSVSRSRGWEKFRSDTLTLQDLECRD
jgi:hypothetical protein